MLNAIRLTYLQAKNCIFEGLKGIVRKSTGSWYSVITDSGQTYDCRIKGKFRIKGLEHATNPIAVGDSVTFELEPGQATAIITELDERKNYIIRRATNLSRQSHIIASNLDQALLVVTLAQPRTSLGFIDRFLVTAEAYSIPCTLIFNKSDLYSAEEMEILRSIESIYSTLGYYCLEVSALHGTNTYQLQSLLQDKTSLLSGHSGVGKSTLINLLVPDLSLKTDTISDYSSKGKHTTTFAEMHTLPDGGYIIDTPGIKEFGLVDMEKEEVSHYFPEMVALLNQCKFHNCTHLDEPGCAVIEAVRHEKIAFSRYESYLSIASGEDNRH